MCRTSVDRVSHCWWNLHLGGNCPLVHQADSSRVESPRLGTPHAAPVDGLAEGLHEPAMRRAAWSSECHSGLQTLHWVPHFAASSHGDGRLDQKLMACVRWCALQHGAQENCSSVPFSRVKMFNGSTGKLITARESA